MLDQQHTQEGQRQRAKRLREQIEDLKTGRPIQAQGPGKSLREQVEERANRVSTAEFGEYDESHES